MGKQKISDEHMKNSKMYWTIKYTFNKCFDKIKILRNN